MTSPALRRVRKRGPRRTAGLRARPPARRSPSVGDAGRAGQHERRQVEEVGEAVAIFLRRLEVLHLGEVDREAGIAVHEADDVAVVAGDDGDRLVLADAEPDLAGEACRPDVTTRRSSGRRWRDNPRRRRCGPGIAGRPGKKRAVPPNGPPGSGGLRPSLFNACIVCLRSFGPFSASCHARDYARILVNCLRVVVKAFVAAITVIEG